MNAYSQESFEGMYDWQQDGFSGTPASFPSTMRPGYPEHQFGLAPAAQFSPEFGPTVTQRPFQMPSDYRSDSPHSAPPSSGTWSGSFPTQDVMYHPELDITKFNRGSRGSMNSLSLTSMRTPHMFPNAYTPKGGMRPHALSVSTVGSEEQPWNLIPDRMPFAQDGSAMMGASFFLRSPTPTKRQRTNQACEKCRERKAKCNGGRPTCQRCAARGHICEYAKERRMRGPNKTGRRGSQADLDDPIDSPSRAVASLDTESETNRGDSPASSRPGSRRSSSEDQTEQGSDPRAKSTSGSPEPAPASGPTAPIALPTLSHGNLSLMQYPMGPSVPRPSGPDHQRAIPSESVIRYAQSMPQLGYRHAQSHDGFHREGPSTNTWNGQADNQAMSGMNVPDAARGDESSSEYPQTDLQTLHYSVSDVSSSSTPITPDRFEYAWPPPADSHSPQQNTFQFGHEKPQTILPTLPEFDNESNSVGELRVWSESHSDRHAMMGAESQQN